MAEPQPEASSDQHIQVIQRSEVCGEADGCDRVVYEPARESHRAVCGRKDADSGAEPHTTRSAVKEGPLRYDDTRLQTQRHHRSVCRSRSAGGQGHCRLLQTPSPPGVPEIPAAYRSRVFGDTALHLVMDNSGSHNTPQVKAWLTRHPRF